ncbi:hypothetical protein AKJ16_DCAP24356 [Drosera capensis]
MCSTSMDAASHLLLFVVVEPVSACGCFLDCRELTANAAAASAAAYSLSMLEQSKPPIGANDGLLYQPAGLLSALRDTIIRSQSKSFNTSSRELSRIYLPLSMQETPMQVPYDTSPEVQKLLPLHRPRP